MWKDSSDVQSGIIKGVGEREKFAGQVNHKRSFLMAHAYFYVNLQQNYLLPSFTDDEFSETHKVANKYGLKMATEKLVGVYLLPGKVA